MLRCSPDKRDSCDTYNSAGSSINSMAYLGGYMYAGLDSGRMVRQRIRGRVLRLSEGSSVLGCWFFLADPTERSD